MHHINKTIILLFSVTISLLTFIVIHLFIFSWLKQYLYNEYLYNIIANSYFLFWSLIIIYRKESGSTHHAQKESDVFRLFLRNNGENHFLFSIVCLLKINLQNTLAWKDYS